MTSGLIVPFVTAADPEQSGEGSLDPLGLARIADRLADEIAPEVTARMQRARFVTAIAVSSRLLGDPTDVGPDGTPAYLAFEWQLLEAFVSNPPASGTEGVPGIRKARTQLRQAGRHLRKEAYLEAPKVFGFHGVYKRLARDIEIVDEQFVLLPRGEQLLAAWEREQHLVGFVNGRKGTDGGKLATVLEREVQKSLEAGEVQLGRTSKWSRLLSAALAPADAGREERRRLWAWISERTRPMRSELAKLVARDLDSVGSERQAIRGFLGAADLSAEMRARLQAIDAYEDAVRLLDDGFRLLRTMSSQRTPSAIPRTEAANHPNLIAIAASLPSALRNAARCLEQVGLAVDLESALGPFAEPMTATQLVDAILDRHDAVQAAKGKRSWFDREEDGFAVRSIGRIDEPFAARSEYLHPYRVYALRAFAADLRPA